MEIDIILKEAIRKGASDMFIIAGAPLSFKINNAIVQESKQKLMPKDTQDSIHTLYTLGQRDIGKLLEKGDDDFSFSLVDVGRFRVNAYRQRGSLAAVIRMVKFDLPDPKALGISKEIIDFYKKKKGLILVTGPAGSGKSTTLSCIIDKVNKERSCHVITLEDPIEYIHKHEKSIVSQREIPSDTESYVQGLKAALRESPDVILLGEMRDFETIQIAMTAAETGQLVFSTLHTLGAANTIDRIIDVFPAVQQQQIRVQLSMVLEAVVSQQLIPNKEGELVPAFEVMIANNAIRNMIREGKIHQIDTVIYASIEEGMQSMDANILKLYENNIITDEEAKLHSTNYEFMSKRIKAIVRQ